MATDADDALDTIAGWLRDANAIVILTGAGISTESGIPDFRGPQGVWTKNPGAEKTANLEYYVNDPEVRKQAWQNRLRSEIWAAQPNDGHRAIAELEQKAKVHTLVTQNIDGLHQAAGSSPDKTIEIHGTVHGAKCLQCGWRGPMSETLQRVEAGEEDPECLVCGGMLKSATISFGENLVPEDLERAHRAAQRADLFLALGTSLGVYPAAGLPEVALSNGARLVIGNAQPTPFDQYAAATSQAPLGELLPALVARI
jgi:NAD-dependent deacetylase